MKPARPVDEQVHALLARYLGELVPDGYFVELKRQLGLLLRSTYMRGYRAGYRTGRTETRTVLERDQDRLFR